MAECDHCETEVLHVWNHRRPSETMTYRTTEWLCSGCHPELRQVFEAGYC